jgi:hypothetical protein
MYDDESSLSEFEQEIEEDLLDGYECEQEEEEDK